MPGIFGIIDASLSGSRSLPEELLAQTRVMLRSMRLEAWYSSRLMHVPAAGASVGQVELRPLAHQSGPLLTLTTGERATAVASGTTPEDIFQGIGGTSAGLVAEPSSGRVILFNDRYGRERLFVRTVGSRTFFASEAKAILAVCPEARAFDTQGLAEFLACGCTLTTRSLFRGIAVLEPGTMLSFDRDGVRISRYFVEQELERGSRLSADDFRASFTAALRTEVRRAAIAEPASALSLTGGLDSRMIAACLADGPPLPSYTFGSMYRKTGDVSVAQSVAGICGLPHQVIGLGGEFLANFRQTFDRSVYISDGYLGLSGAAELHVNALARAIAPARITGNWGGEMMRGVRAFKFTVPKGNFLRPELLDCMTQAEAAFSPRIADPLSGTLFHQIPLQGYGRYVVERSQVITRTPFLAPQVVEALYGAAPEVRRACESAAAVIGQRPALLGLPTDAGVVVTRPARARKLWRRAAIKTEYMTSHGAPDWMARLAAVLPAPVLETRFLGVDKFYHFRHWMRHQLAPTVKAVLAAAAPRLEQSLDLERVRAMADQHCRGQANYTDSLDKVMTLATAERMLFDDAAWQQRLGDVSTVRDEEQARWA
ncbi:Asparagine synthetase [glutamine-hydrolyzing] 3 [Luteitalea pratensis]|uniref:asparagine synthase (glutamine-hydrolyzing) n=1 Tax=Luteitalea pratensis TaxID=1855912 RepID=A0A143PXT2_LUTPR|nr:asparagine synthase-related protein [Luteitalea pratensis]AMY12983.1 Asparagine synthetase [glutamine-hydrolyzing] 3 [Luteitalea pratensis]